MIPYIDCQSGGSDQASVWDLWKLYMVSVRRFVEFCVELYVLLHGLGFIGLNPKPYPTAVP